MQKVLLLTLLMSIVNTPISVFPLDSSLVAAKMLLRQQQRGEIARWGDVARTKVAHRRASLAHTPQLISARDLIGPDGAADSRLLRQALKILQDVSQEAKERRFATGTAEALPGDILHEFTGATTHIGTALWAVWNRYCISDMPPLLQSLLTTWSTTADLTRTIFS